MSTTQSDIDTRRRKLADAVLAEMADMFEVERMTLTPKTHLFKDLGLDSLDAIDLAVRLEDLTGQRVEEQALRKLRTVGDVLELVETLQRRAAPAAE